MITQENIEINDREFLRTYSDTYYIKQVQTGIVYAEAIDIIPCSFTYEETDEPLPEPEPIQEPEEE